jgi:diaminopropionate ammonia-lyase
MRVLGNPIGDDRRIISGESGAVTAGIVYELLTEESLLGLKKKIGLDENSVILLISTEGDTDKENYRRIVWDGHIPI